MPCARAACAPESADIRRAKSASRGAKRRSGPRWCGPLSGSQPPVRENGRASASQPSPLSRKHAPPCPSGRTSRTQYVWPVRRTVNVSPGCGSISMKADNRTFNLDCWPLIGTASPTASTSRYASVKMPVISKGAPSLGRYVTASPNTSITGAITASSQSIDISDHRRGQRRVHAAWNHNRRGLHHQIALRRVFVHPRFRRIRQRLIIERGVEYLAIGARPHQIRHGHQHHAVGQHRLLHVGLIDKPVVVQPQVVLPAELSNGKISPACLYTSTARDAAPTRAAAQNAYTKRPSAAIPDAANTAATSPVQCGRAQYPVLEVESDG